MTISKSGIELIKHFEAFVSGPYLDAALVPTIGYGTTHYIDRPVDMNDPSISQETAEYILRTQVDDTYSKAVNHYVRVPLTQNQFDSLVSFAYNVGTYALKKSTLLKKINDGKFIEASKEFVKWDHVAGKVSRGLLGRRVKERDLFLA